MYDKNGFDVKLTAPIILTKQKCDDGYFCEIDTTVNTPTGLGAVMPRPTGKYCVAGYKCVSGVKEACASNFYQERIGQNACKACPSGYQCPVTLGSAGPPLVPNLYKTRKICGQNYYCPANQWDKISCGNGYYTLNKVSGSNTDCRECPAGYYCTSVVSADSDINDAVMTQCPAGKYCPNKSYEVATPTSPVIACPAGYYCLAGAPQAIPCPSGYYCAAGANSAFPTTLCTAGYYCTLAATTATPTDGVTGNICPAGHYCLSTAT